MLAIGLEFVLKFAKAKTSCYEANPKEKLHAGFNANHNNVE